jgi:hypothetical protein
MLLSEIVYNIKNLMAGGVQSDDNPLSDTQLGFIVGYYRAKLIRQDQQKGRLNKQLFIQNLGKLPLIQADKNECCDITSCILRTKFAIPTPLETFDSLNITFVGTIDGRPFDQRTHNVLYWNKHAKYTGKEPKWYYQNGYIYIINAPGMITNINIQGIFEDPLYAAQTECSCQEQPVDCGSLDFDYKMPLHYVDLIVKLVAQTEMTILTGLPQDLTNDSMSQLNKATNAK